MDERLLDNVWQSQIISVQPISVGTTCLKEAPLVSDDPWKIHGLCIEETWQNKKKRPSHLLPEQEIHKLWVQVLVAREDVLCFGLDNTKSKVAHVVSHHLASGKAEPYQVHFWKAILVEKISQVAGLVVRIWNPISFLESDKGKCNHWIPLWLKCRWLRTDKVWFPRWGLNFYHANR